MEITASSYVDVRERAEQLGCAIPTMIAILPRNFATAAKKDELVHESNAMTVRTLLRNAGIEETRVEVDGERFPCIQENDFTWAGPIIFCTSAALSDNPALLSVSLNIISNYLTEFFRGVTGQRRVILDVVVEQTRAKKCVRLHYEGLPDQVEELAARALDSVRNDK